MIADWDTNKVYFSEIFSNTFPEEFRLINNALTANGVKVGLLSKTNDLWCRDYMPVQVGQTNFVRFNYNPSYLMPKRHRYLKTDNSLVCKHHGIDTTASSVVLDGGNVVKSRTKAIITDKIFDENPSMPHDTLLQELSARMDCEVIIIPHHADDYTGHADGMVRFINESMVLVNNLSKELPSFRFRLTQALDKHGINFIEMPFFLGKNAIGCYVNYLQTKTCILVPAFGMPEDLLAINLLKHVFPETVIIPIESTRIAAYDGVLNCISWNIKE